MEINKFGYYWLDTWILANVIQLATQDFCTRNLNRTNVPAVSIIITKTAIIRLKLKGQKARKLQSWCLSFCLPSPLFP